MNYSKITLVAVAFLICVAPSWGELSSKAKKAERLIADGKFSEAVEIYKGLMAKNQQKEAVVVKEGREGMAACLVLQAKAALTTKKFEDAKAACVEVVKAYKDTAAFKDASKYLIGAQLEISAQLMASGKFDECAAQCRAVKALVPPGSEGMPALNHMIVDASMKLGEDLIKQQKHEDAQLLFENIAAEFADIADISAVAKQNASKCSYALGLCFRLSKQRDKAFAAYQNVTVKYKDTPVAAAAYSDLYIMYKEQNDNTNALNAIKQAVTLEPANSDFLFKEVELLADMGKTEDAQKNASVLLALLQDEVQRTYLNKEIAQYRMGEAQLILGNFTEAVVEFDKALARNPSMLDAKRGLALAQFNDKNFSGALVTYDALLNQYSPIFSDASQKASADQASTELAKKVEELRKEMAFFHFQKGLALEQLGEYDKALSECRLGLEGVSTKDAAVTLKRIQGVAQKKAESVPIPK